MKRLCFMLLLVATGAHAQMPGDGGFLLKRQIMTGVIYSRDQWKEYWEGTLKRENQNIGTLTTESAMWMGAFGLNERTVLFVAVPYVSTKASGGTLAGLSGIQDLSIGGKYKVWSAALGKGTVSLIGAGVFTTPASNYTPDFLPLSIGLHSTTFNARLGLHYQLESGWYGLTTHAYTFRSNVRLDRPSYYTNNTFYETSEVKMYDVYDYLLEGGYKAKLWSAGLQYTQQNTLGGGDIRRQDMPFVSNMMNFKKIGVYGMVCITPVQGLMGRVSASYVVDGLNVGQSFNWSAGLIYQFGGTGTATTTPQ